MITITKKRFLIFLLAALAVASCSRGPAVAPAAAPGSADRAELEQISGQLEQARSRLRRGEKITDPNQVCLLYAYGALGDDTELLELLRKTATDINAANSFTSETALHLAVLEGTPAAVRRLLERGARLDTRNRNGKSVFYDAVCGGNEELVRLLLEKGADPNDYEPVYGTTVLLAAAADNQLAIVRLLLERKADPNAGSHSTGATPLHFAVLEGYRELAELLLERGADPNAKTKAGRTPLQVALDNPQAEMIALLKQHGAR